MAMINSVYLMIIVSFVGCGANLGPGGVFPFSGSSGAPDHNPNLNVHKNLCDDVSHYGPVEYKNETRPNCTTTFEKKCTSNTERICRNVTDMICELTPYTDCTMNMDSATYTETAIRPKIYSVWKCDEYTELVEHEKYLPKCKQVVKQNCDTIWSVDPNGKKIWDGTKNCKPVEWQECELVLTKVPYNATKTRCYPDRTINYDDFVTVNKTRMTTGMTCKVKEATNCQTMERKDCKSIDVPECVTEKKEVCEDNTLNVPTQKYIHKKKCILDEDPLRPITDINLPVSVGPITQEPLDDQPDETDGSGNTAGGSLKRDARFGLDLRGAFRASAIPKHPLSRKRRMPSVMNERSL